MKSATKKKTASQSGGGPGLRAVHPKDKKEFQLAPEKLKEIHNLMVKSRLLEERLIQMYKQSDGYFWIGGPGEEAFNVSLGLQAKKGSGPQYDFFHLHYRSSAIMMAMGEDPINPLRQMKNTATDPYSRGRNFSNHYSKREWNVVPVASTIETQYQSAIGTGIAQMREGGEGITIVNGGDAGTAEGDFASCLVWASRPGNELPILIIVLNNGWGISTAADTQHGDKNIHERGTAFGIKNKCISGFDVEESWFGLKEAMDYIRKERKPFLLEVKAPRLYGHSSADGAKFKSDLEDPLKIFEGQLENCSILGRDEMDKIHKAHYDELLELSKKVKAEPMPDPSSIYDYTYCGQKGRYW